MYSSVGFYAQFLVTSIWEKRLNASWWFLITWRTCIHSTWVYLKYDITLLRSITMFCEIDNIAQNNPHIYMDYANILEYFVKYYQSHKVLLWVWIMSKLLHLTIESSPWFWSLEKGNMWSHIEFNLRFGWHQNFIMLTYIGHSFDSVVNDACKKVFFNLPLFAKKKRKNVSSEKSTSVWEIFGHNWTRS